MTIRQNALWNCKNPYQGEDLKVLTVCSAGLLRSPTIAYYLTKQYGYNCRAVGIHDYALVPIDEVLVEWADIIVCSDKEKQEYVNEKYPDYLGKKYVLSLDLPDIFRFKQPTLLQLIEERLDEKEFFKHLPRKKEAPYL